MGLLPTAFPAHVISDRCQQTNGLVPSILCIRAPGRTCPAARRAVPIQPAGRAMSHKLTTYLDVSIALCPKRNGDRSLGEGTGSVPVARGGPAGGPVGPFLQILLIFMPPFTPGLWLFMPIYFILSY